jgi:hypothetical protein
VNFRLHPISRFYIFFLIMTALTCVGQNDSTRKPFFSIGVSAITNRSFSHLFHTSSEESRYSSRTVSNLDDRYTFGCEGGISFFLPIGQSASIVWSLAYSQTSGRYKYHRSALNEGKSTASLSVINATYNVTAGFVNIGLGFQHKFVKNLFLRHGLVISKGVSVRVHEESISTVSLLPYNANAPGAPSNINQTDITSNDQFYYETFTAVSLRLAVGLHLKKIEADVIVFRNLGITMKLPWWGLGFYKNI